MEYNIHKSISNYIKLQYPNVVFTSDSSGVRMTIGNAKKMLALKSKHKIPDMIILHPNQRYHGLILEIKDYDKSPYKKNGELRQNEHTLAQAKTLEMLNKAGYKALFVVGFDEAIQVITDYFTDDKKGL